MAKRNLKKTPNFDFDFWTVISFLLAGVGIYLLWIGSQLFVGLSLVLVSAILFNGLPTKRDLRTLVRTSPIGLILGAGVGLFYFRYFGATTALESVFASIFVVFIVQQFGIKAYQKLIRD